MIILPGLRERRFPSGVIVPALRRKRKRLDQTEAAFGYPALCGNQSGASHGGIQDLKHAVGGHGINILRRAWIDRHGIHDRISAVSVFDFPPPLPAPVKSSGVCRAHL
jgi:hypothetical protein